MSLRPAADRALQVPCPTCKRRIAYASSNPWRPFCSERCRGIDLGAWASERFRVAAAADSADDAGAYVDPDRDDASPRA